MKKAYALIVRNGLILLVRHTGNPTWDLPGGGVLPNESERDAIKRIIFETLGIKSEIKELIGIYSKEFRDDLTYVYHGVEERSKSVICSPVYGKVAFFDIENLPLNTVPERRRQVKDYLSGRYPVRIRLKESKLLFHAENFVRSKLKKKG